MIIDVVCAAFCLIYAILGFLSGGLKQLVKLVAVILAYFSAVWASPIISEILAEYIRIPVNYLEIAALLIAWIVFYIIYSIIGRLFVRMLHEASETITGLDGVVGLLLGLLKALVIILLFGMAINSQRARIIHHRPESKQTLDESYIMKIVDNIDKVEEWLPDDTMKVVDLLGSVTNKIKIDDKDSKKSKPKMDYKKNLLGSKDKDNENKKDGKTSDPADNAVKKVEDAEKNDALEKLTNNKEFKKILDDKEFMDSLKDKDKQELLNDKRVQELLNNPQIMELIKTIQGDSKK